MKIRNGNLSDFDQIVDLFKILDVKHIENQDDFRYPPNSKRYSQLLDMCLNANNYCLSIAEMDGKLIGFGIGRLLNVVNHSYYKDKKVGEVLYLIIDPNHKFQGHGKTLLDDLENRLTSIGAERLELKVYDFNKEAYPEKANYKKKFTVYEKIAVQKQP